MTEPTSDRTKKAGKSLLNIAGIVAVATLLSKVFGLLRQMAIAAAFGAGPAYDAYNYAYVVPGFLLILLGGINGPFYSAIVSVVSKRKSEEAAPLIETINTLVGMLLLVVSVLLFAFAEPLLDIYAPGLSQTTRNIAIEQFRIMAPMALLSGLIGIGFGALNAADHFWLPSISPLLSSVTVIFGVSGMYLVLRERMFEPQYMLLGGQVLAYSTLAGALLQWLAQLPALAKSGLGGLRLRFNFKQPGVAEILQILGPATFSSGMMQINVYTDLYFASPIPEAASALGYATLLVQTPLGILSNVILVPLLPTFSRLADPSDWPELKLRIRQGMMLTAITMLPLSALMIALAFPMVRVVYERGAFTKDTSQFVASVLMAYGVGMFVYLGRDILVRVFYALGDGDTPFRISIVNIGINAFLDFLLVKPFGAPGLVLATVGVNVLSMVALLWFLNRKLHGLPWKEWGIPVLQLSLASAIAGFASWGVLKGSQHVLGSDGLLIILFQLGLAGGIGLGIFAAIVLQLNLPEVRMFVERIQQRFLKSKG